MYTVTRERVRAYVYIFYEYIIRVVRSILSFHYRCNGSRL